MQRIDENFRVDELLGKQLAIPIVKDGSQFHRPGGGIDLVIDGAQCTLGDFVAAGSIVSGNWQYRAGSKVV